MTSLGGFVPQRVIPSQLRGPDVGSQGVGKLHFSKALGRSVLSLLQLLAVLGTPFGCPCLRLHHPSLCVSQIPLYLFLMRITVVGFPAHPDNLEDDHISRFLVWLYLQSPFSQVRQHLQVPGIRCGHSFLETINPTHGRGSGSEA